jgi:hypothetical protein
VAFNPKKTKKLSSYPAWKSAVKSAGATKIDGDKDIATALDANGRGVGEWDGETGEVYIFEDEVIPKPVPRLEAPMNAKQKSIQAKKDMVNQAYAKMGSTVSPGIDKDEYPPIKGMEGPFRYRSGKILYYDPKEGEYYDRKTDMYQKRAETTKEADDMDGEDTGYEDSLKDNIGDIVMDDSLDAEAKIAKLLALVGSEEEAVDGGEDKPMDEAEDVALEIGDEEDDEKKEMSHLKTEESIRRRKDPALTKLMEEVDAYRARDRRDRLMGEARKLCENANLPKYAITETFLGILSETQKNNWKALVEDRRRVIFRGEQPVSAVAPNGELTVDSLVKALRS